MTNLSTIALFSLITLAGVAGCSSDTYDTSKNSDQATNADYRSSNNSYMHDTSVGTVMTTPRGMTVYTFDKDQGGQSNCYGECAMHWPPVTAASDAQPFGNMSVVERTDGSRQWAYGGKPLYTYHDDTTPGNVEGDGKGGIWHVVK
jgi:predicted lipoprotein with Yx(FWY)xxD motif